MFACPACSASLNRVSSERGIAWICPACGGRAVGIGVVRRALPAEVVRHIWVGAVERGQAGDRECPVCENAMQRVPPAGTVPSDIDVCRRCQFVWFDPSEYEAAPEMPLPEKREMPQEALERLGRARSTQIAEDFRRRYPQPELGPGAWEMIPGALGLPLEEDDVHMETFTWVTWVVLALLVAGGVLSFMRPELRAQWGLLPDEPFRNGGLTFFASFFLHGGLYHLISNIWFMAVFGDDVEDFLGHANFLLLLFVASLAGALAHTFLTSAKDVPLVGASAGISGVIAFYALRFPQARLRYFRLYRWYTMPASLAMGFWAFSQVFGARSQISGQGDVSYIAHIGGALVGLWFWFLWREP